VVSAVVVVNILNLENQCVLHARNGIVKIIEIETWNPSGRKIESVKDDHMILRKPRLRIRCGGIG